MFRQLFRAHRDRESSARCRFLLRCECALRTSAAEEKRSLHLRCERNLSRFHRLHAREAALPVRQFRRLRHPRLECFRRAELRLGAAQPRREREARWPRARPTISSSRESHRPARLRACRPKLPCRDFLAKASAVRHRRRQTRGGSDCRRCQLRAALAAADTQAFASENLRRRFCCARTALRPLELLGFSVLFDARKQRFEFGDFCAGRQLTPVGGLANWAVG